MRKRFLWSAGWRTGITVFIIAGLTGLAFFADRYVRSRALTDAVDHSRVDLDRLQFRIEARLRVRANDFFLLKQAAETELAKGDAGGVQNRDWQELAKTVMLARGGYPKVRMLTPTGREDLRINWIGETEDPSPRIEEVSADSLQDKSDRPFFKEAMAASRDTVVFSPLDLNVENGKIEVPFRPMVRLSGKVCNPDGSVAGVLVLNCDGNLILRELYADATVWGHPLLLNPEGFWLVGPEGAAEWAFQFPGKENLSLARQDPERWNKLSSTKSGWFMDGGTLYSHRRVDPSGGPTSYPVLRIATVGGEKLCWVLLTTVPAAALWATIKVPVMVIWLAWAASVLIFAPGAWMLASAVQRRQEAQREVARSRAELNLVLTTAPDAIVALQAERNGPEVTGFRVILWNAAMEGLTSGEVSRGSYPGKGDAGFLERLRGVLETGAPIAFEQEFAWPTGKRWLGMRAVKMRDGVVIFVADISEAKLASLRLQESKDRLQLALEGSRSGMWDFDFVTGVMRMDEGWCRLLGYESGEVTCGPDFHDRFVHPDDLPMVRAGIQDCVARRKTLIESEQRHRAKSGEWRWMLLRGKIISFDGDGQPIRAIGTVLDVTAQRLAREELHRAKAEAEQASKDLSRALETQQKLATQAQAAERAKGEFLAMMSHEIRTPMNGVLGFAELLSNTSLAPEQQSYLETICTSGELLLHIIDDILDFSRIEAGHLKIESHGFAPSELMEGIRTVLSPRAQQKGLSIVTEIGADVPERVEGDSHRLRQVLVNLAGNAIKFTERGGVTLALRAGPASAPGGCLEFSVRDTGEGISAEKLEQIFQPFVQADSSVARRYGGTGLGLAISKRLVELMGGQLRVENWEGGGALFRFSVPVGLPGVATYPNQRSERESLDAHFAELHPLRIVVADDDAVNLRLIDAVLHKLGYTPVLTRNGFEALEIYEKIRPDCLLLDMQMKGMDGVTAAKRIRQLETRQGIHPPCYISALTANVLVSERETCREAGMDDFLSKPLRTDALAVVLAKAHTVRRESEAAGAAEEEHLISRQAS